MKPITKLKNRNVSASGSFPLRHAWLGLAALGLILCDCGLTAAESSVAAIQQELKKEQYFFKEPNGKLDDATRSALRRFQIRRGLPATGEIDTATMEALRTEGEGGIEAAESRSPQTAVPALPPSTMERDREFLRRVETNGELAAAEARNPGEPSGSPASAWRRKSVPQLYPPPAPAPHEQEAETEAGQPNAPSYVAPDQPIRQHDSLAPSGRNGRDEAVAQSESFPPPIASRPAEDGTDRSSDEVISTRPEAPRRAVTYKRELTQTQGDDRIQRSDREPTNPSYPRRRMERSVASAPPEIGDGEYDAAPAAPPGSVTTYRVRTTTADGRTYIYERRVDSPWEVYRPEVVEPRTREGFFHRLFHRRDFTSDE